MASPKLGQRQKLQIMQASNDASITSLYEFTFVLNEFSTLVKSIYASNLHWATLKHTMKIYT